MVMRSDTIVSSTSVGSKLPSTTCLAPISVPGINIRHSSAAWYSGATSFWLMLLLESELPGRLPAVS